MSANLTYYHERRITYQLGVFFCGRRRVVGAPGAIDDFARKKFCNVTRRRQKTLISIQTVATVAFRLVFWVGGYQKSNTGCSPLLGLTWLNLPSNFRKDTSVFITHGFRQVLV